jgi:hypothetical protein
VFHEICTTFAFAVGIASISIIRPGTLVRQELGAAEAVRLRAGFAEAADRRRSEEVAGLLAFITRGSRSARVAFIFGRRKS